MDLSNITENLNQINPEDIANIKLQIQNLNDTIKGGLRSNNVKTFRSVYIINAQDSLDASYPMYIHFSIIPEMVKIVSIAISFWFLNFRAYSTAASSGGAVSSASGGGETPTSSSGGGVTSASGGGETPTSSASSAASSASGGGETPTSAAGGVVSSASGGGSTPTSSSESGTPVPVITSLTTTAVTVVGAESASGLLITAYGSATVPQNAHTHTVTIAAHTHTGGSHTHTVTIAAHTHGIAHTHTVTVAAHTHTGGAHTHTVTVAAHTHTGGAHTHGITYGIFEDSTSPTVMLYVSRDNGLTYSLPTGSYTADHENLDITSMIDTVGGKLIKFTSNARTRLSVQVTVKLDISAR